MQQNTNRKNRNILADCRVELIIIYDRINGIESLKL